jgi:serpin B
LFILLTGPAITVSEEEAHTGPLVEGNTAFAVDLYHQLRTAEGNLFYSPYSVSTVLGMTYAGARGNTAAQMAAALHFKLDQAQLHPAFKGLSQELTARALECEMKLNIANALCLTDGDVNISFKTLLKEDYDAELFAGGLDEINNWVKKKTEGKIDKILESLNANSVCVLLNAIYFKGTWQSQFKRERTHDAPFSVSAKKQVTVSLMSQRGNYRILQEKGFQVAAIPYKGAQLSMVILLPQESDGLSTLEQQLTAQSLGKWLGELDRQPAQEVDLYIPKFKLETGYDLAPPCRKLGMNDAFDPTTADFSGIGWHKGVLWISQIKHKAFVEVNEEGTEAAAATAVEIATRSVRQYPVFRADHPFLFMIRDNKTGSLLFMGRMVDPGSK